ncbi:MAG: flagellar basal body rod protein FlgB [Myxococcota bacterium]
MPAIPLDSLVNRLGTVLELREQQHALTASNLANADTPGYQAKVMEFGDLLSQVVEGTAGAEPSAQVTELKALPWSVNGNSVVAEREMARLQENSMMYGALTRGLSRRLAVLKFAASDGR